VIVDNLDVMSITFSEFEANSPRSADSHRPLLLAIALELVEADALSGLRSRNDFATFKASNKSMAASKSNPRNWFGLPPSQTLRVAALRQDRIMAKMYYVAQ
jgi:hypothetical protein